MPRNFRIIIYYTIISAIFQVENNKMLKIRAKKIPPEYLKLRRKNYYLFQYFRSRLRKLIAWAMCGF